MKGYIYTMFSGADPGQGWTMTDPIYGKVPTLGACMPNIRRSVEQDDYIFSVSGKVLNVKQYVVGAFSVDEKINALAAYKRLPENRMHVGTQGTLFGNIIVDANGHHLDCDYHKDHERRIENYIIGKDLVVIEGEKQVEKAREETLYVLNQLFGKNEDTIRKVLGRWRKLDEAQIKDLLNWMNDIRKG